MTADRADSEVPSFAVYFNSLAARVAHYFPGENGVVRQFRILKAGAMEIRIMVDRFYLVN